MGPALPVLAALLGVAACALALFMVGKPLRQGLLAALAMGILGLAILSRRPKEVLLFTWVLALTYNRQYFSFDSWIGDFGSQGLYWIPADLPFACLLLLWMGESRNPRRDLVPRGRPLWPWLLPFAAASGASLLVAARPDWGLCEAWRIFKLLVVLAYARANLGLREWRLCAVALGTAVVLQSGIAISQAVFNVKGGLLGFVGISGSAAATAAERFGDRMQLRSGGTMAAANYLASYLLLLLPAFLALWLAATRMSVRLAAAAVVGMGLLGLTSTMSRGPWVLCMLELAAVLLGLTALRLVSARRAAGLAAVGAMLLLLALLPIAGKIQQRFSRDWSESVEFRARYNRVALEMARKNMLLGVGLNNFRLYLEELAPDLEAIFREADGFRKEIGVRVTAPVHNLYLLVLAETGVLGLGAFLLFLGALLQAGFRAVASTSGSMRLVCYGLTLGLLFEALQQTIDFSLWSDPGLHTLMLIGAMLAAAPALGGQAARVPAPARGGPAARPGAAMLGLEP